MIKKCLIFFLSEPLPILKNYRGLQINFSLYGLYLSTFTITKIKIDTFTAATASHDYLMEY